jgi:hypothetical protein
MCSENVSLKSMAFAALCQTDCTALIGPGRGDVDRSDRRMRGFRDPERAQAFLSSFGPIRQHFPLKRHLLCASFYRLAQRSIRDQKDDLGIKCQGADLPNLSSSRAIGCMTAAARP